MSPSAFYDLVGNPVRFSILLQLRSGVTPVSVLPQKVGMSQSTVAKCVSQLVWAGVVEFVPGAMKTAVRSKSRGHCYRIAASFQRRVARLSTDPSHWVFYHELGHRLRYQIVLKVKQNPGLLITELVAEGLDPNLARVHVKFLTDAGVLERYQLPKLREDEHGEVISLPTHPKKYNRYRISDTYAPLAARLDEKLKATPVEQPLVKYETI